MKKNEWLLCGYIACCAFSWALTALMVSDILFELRMHRSEQKAHASGVPSIAPHENLATAPESLRLGLAVECPDSVVDQVTKTKAWNALQDRASEYARRLEFLEERYDLMQDRSSMRYLWMQGSILACVIGMFVLHLLLRQSSRAGVRGQAGPAST